MPTMSRPALDVKGGTSPVKEVTVAILQVKTLRHRKTHFPGVMYLVSLSRKERSRLSLGGNESSFHLYLVKWNLLGVLKDGEEESREEGRGKQMLF